MAIPTWTSGQVLTASDVNTYFVPIAAVKTATESVTSSTTLQNDDTLVVSVAATGTWEVTIVLVYDGAAAGDLKVGFTGPAGVAFVAQAGGLGVSGTLSTDDFTGNLTSISDTVNFGCNGAGTTLIGQIIGTVRTTGTSGSLQVQWAQVTSSGTATRVFADSYIVIRRIS